MASRKEYEMLFQLNAQLGGSYNSTFNKAQKAVLDMQKEIQALSKTQSDISAYQKQQSAVDATKKKLDVLRQQYDNIQREMDETGNASSTLQNRLLAKQQQIDKTSASLQNQVAKLEQMRAALQATGVNTDELDAKLKELTGQIDGLKQKQEEAADEANRFGSTASTAFGAVGQAIVAAGIVVALKQIVDGYAECIEASMEFENAMTGVSKTTDMSVEELAAMSEEIKFLSTEIPVTTTELAAVAEVAGQLGIAKDNLLDFSTVMSMLATATTMTADEAATMLAQFANITQMNPAYYSNLASTIVDLGNNYATTEQKITEMAQGIAASASLAGMSEADMMALSAAVTSLGIETQAGSTSMSKLISELMTAVETGDNLNEFARIAGMSANEFATAWGDNAVGALQAFVTGLSDTERNGKSATVALTELGITETRMQRMILSLSNSGDLLNRTLVTANNAWGQNTALTAEAEKRYATTQSQLVLMQNSYNNLKIAIGDQFTPELRKLYAIATDVLGAVTEFVQKNPALVKAITAFVAIIGVAVVGLTAYAAVAKLAATASALLTAAIPGVNIIMGVVAGVAALTAGIIALTSATNEEEEAVRALSATSREQYYELQDLRAEYEEVCNAMGETSAEAQLLKAELDDATEAFESNKQTAEELAEAHREIIDSHNELMDAYGDTVHGLDDETTSAHALMEKLEDLMSVEGKSAETKQQILSIVELLNEAMPELGLAYDAYADSLNMTAEGIRAVIEAELDRERNAANYEQLKSLIAEESGLYENLETQIAEVTAAQNAATQAELDYAAAVEYANARWPGATPNGPEQTYRTNYINEYSRALDEANEYVETATGLQQEAQTAYDENQAAINELTETMAGYAEETGNADGVTDALNEKIGDITSRMNELAEAYTEAYSAALESVQGQYDLWDEASQVVATNASSINSALESQISYWENYNANLANLSDRSADIEGLSEMIASFADGSEGSVNAIAGMASATDDELAAMVQNWQGLQEEQKAVADNLAQMETDFAASMDVLQQELESAISDMDMNEAAATSGKSTIQGFIDGANDMLPAVRSAYAAIAQAAVDAIDAQLDINSPSKVLEVRGEYAMSGFVGGVENMTPDVQEAMSMAASAGADAFTSAEEAQIVAFTPQLMAYLTGRDALMAESGGDSSGAYIVLTISPVYNLTGVGNASELEAVLADHDEDLRDYVLEIIEEAGIDTARRKYS